MESVGTVGGGCRCGGESVKGVVWGECEVCACVNWV